MVSMSRLEWQSLLSICLLYVIRMLGLFMVLPVLPLMDSSLPGATPLLIGLALGIYGFFQAVLQIPLGLLSDRIGRKPVIFMGLVIFVAGSIVAGASDSVYGVIAGRCLQGAGAIASTLMALVSDLTRVENRTTAMMMIGISIGGSFALSLVLGPYLGSLFDLSGIFYLTACLGVLGIVVLFGLIPSPQTGSSRFRTGNLDSRLMVEKLGDIVKTPNLIRLDGGIFLVHYMLMSSFLAIPQLLRMTGEIQDSEHHLIYLIAISLSFLLMGPFMRLSDKKSYTKPVLLGAILLFVLSSATFVLEGGLYVVLVGLFLFFMAFNLLEVSLPSLVSREAPAGARGTAMGIYSTSQFAGAFLGGLLGGWIVQMWGITHLMVVNMLVCSLWLVLFYGMKTPRNLVGRTVYFDKQDTRSAIELLEALSSIEGVEDVVLVGTDKENKDRSTGDGEGKVAYLKVDKQKFSDKFLEDCTVAEAVTKIV